MRRRRRIARCRPWRCFCVICDKIIESMRVYCLVCSPSPPYCCLDFRQLYWSICGLTSWFETKKNLIFYPWAGRRSGPPRMRAWSIVGSSLPSRDSTATWPKKWIERVRPEYTPGQLFAPHCPHRMLPSPQICHFEENYFFRVSFSSPREETRLPNDRGFFKTTD